MEEPNAGPSLLSWVHFGDLHIRQAHDENYLDFLELIDDVNTHLGTDVDFAFLPGDNADDGTKDEYELVRSALTRLHVPVHVIAGDHDKKGGSLDLFRQSLEENLYRARDIGGFRLPFLNAMDGADSKTFDFGSEQIQWLRDQLIKSRATGLRPLVFTHLYPSELATQAKTFTDLIREYRVEVVEMGHTHYNELANDGRTVYATTRSTGQSEEGPPGFSITTIDDDAVAWKFKERGLWPFVMITSPADEKLITRPGSARHVIRGTVIIRAKVWGGTDRASLHVTCTVDRAPARSMTCTRGIWQCDWNSRELADGTHRISVRAVYEEREVSDEISVLVNQSGRSTPPARSTLDYENAIGAYPSKGILGAQLGSE